MSAHPAEFVHLCACHALGVVEERDRPRLLEHRAGGCPDCEAALERYHHSVLTIADSLPPVEPRPELRTRVLADAKLFLESRAMEADARHRPLEVKLSPTLSWKGWAFLYLAGALGVIALYYGVEARSLGARLRTQQDESQRLLARVGQQYAQDAPWGAAVLASGARVAVLQPGAPGRASGHAVFDPGTGRAVVSCTGLACPPGRACVLWGRTGSGLARLAVLRPDGSGAATTRLERAGDASLRGLVITLEPAQAQATAPSGPVVLSGELRS